MPINIFIITALQANLTRFNTFFTIMIKKDAYSNIMNTTLRPYNRKHMLRIAVDFLLLIMRYP